MASTIKVLRLLADPTRLRLLLLLRMLLIAALCLALARPRLGILPRAAITLLAGFGGAVAVATPLSTTRLARRCRYWSPSLGCHCLAERCRR